MDTQLLVALGGCLGWLGLSVVALSIGFWRLGAQVVAQGRFPLSGAGRMLDPRRVRGEAALHYGRGLQFFAAAVPVTCLCAAVLAWHAWQMLAASLP